MRVTPHVHALRIPFQVSLGEGRFLDRFAYSYLVEGDDLTLIDSGVAGSETVLFEFIRSIGRQPMELGRLVLTHSHPDHIGSALRLKEATGCQVFVHAAERSWTEDVARQRQERPVPGFDLLVAGSVGVDRTLDDGDSIDMGEMTAKVLHTPGHSPGSISLHLPDEGVLISGDALPLPGDIPIYDDPLLALHSIKRLKAVHPVSTLLSSWEDPINGPRITSRIAASEDVVRSVHRAVRESKRTTVDMQMAAEVLQRIGLPAGMANPMVMRTIAGHLRQLDDTELMD